MSAHAAAATSRNALLRRLPSDELARLQEFLQPLPLVLRTSLAMPGQNMQHLTFPDCGTISMVAIMEDGAQIEVGLIGREGVLGLPLLLGTAVSPTEALIQVAGTAWQLPAAALPEALATAPSLLALALRYMDSFHVQVTQTAACNGHHQIEQRAARWILMTRDRVDDDIFQMTQEFLSHMLGVRRPSVTLALQSLRRAGLVQHGRGELHVLDRAGLEEVACECYAVVRRRFAWLYEDPAAVR